MTYEKEGWHVTPAGGNVFADLGFPRDQAEALKAESTRIIAEKLAIKEKLMEQISQWMAERQLKQAEAASILGITRPRVSDMINKKASKFSIDALIDMVARTGKHVVLIVA
jgi:predicted XRE-type DNA-binding protein